MIARAVILAALLIALTVCLVFLVRALRPKKTETAESSAESASMNTVTGGNAVSADESAAGTDGTVRTAYL